MTSVTVNGRRYNVNLPDDTPLLWALRDELGLTGTKYGCGMALCGACTVHVDGQVVRACMTPISAVAVAKVTTIEAIGTDRVGRALQAAWVDMGVPQCGYCQTGRSCRDRAPPAQPEATDTEIDEAMSANICRCGTYVRIRAAIKQVGGEPVGSYAMSAPRADVATDRPVVFANLSRRGFLRRDRAGRLRPRGRVPVRGAGRRSAQVRRRRHAEWLGG